MTKKLTKPIAFLSAVAMLMTMLLYLPSSVFSDIGLGLSANAAEITPTEPSKGTSGVYQITNAAELYWFAGLVNGTLSGVTQDTSANAKLINDITVNENVLESLENGANGESFTSWTPIGNYDYHYKGTFNGNGKTISGLFCNNSTTDYVGLFGCIDSGKVTDVKVADSYIRGKKYVGGVCGYNYYGEITNCGNSGKVVGTGYVGGVCGDNYGIDKNLTGCYNEGIVIGSGDYTGGVCGYNCSGEITDSYNTGRVSGGDNVGGVCGYNYSTIKNSYNLGDISGTTYVGGVCGFTITNSMTVNCYSLGGVSCSSYVGGVCGFNSGAIANCYYNSTKYTGEAIGYNHSGNSVNVSGKAAASFTSGEVAYLLSIGCTVGETAYDGSVWGQDLENDAYPVLNGTTVYRNEVYSDCVDASVGLSYTYANAEAEAVHVDHVYEKGICRYCGKIQPYAPQQDSDGVYQITNAAELYWFAGLVNGTLDGVSQNSSANAKLINNITVNENLLASLEYDADGNVTNGASFTKWVPISDYSSNIWSDYKGTFNGNGKTISGLFYDNSTTDYAGLFGYINSGKVTDVKVADSYIRGYWYVGGVCGYNNSGEITNCGNSGTVVGTKYVGGVCGYNYSNAKDIADCYNEGTVIGTGDGIGGVCGVIYVGCSGCYNTGKVSGVNNVGGVCGTVRGELINCYNTGDISATGSKVGGVCGNTNSADAKITNCYNTGNVTSTVEDKWYIGGVCGYLWGEMTGCYNTGKVSTTGSKVGGVCGYISGTVKNCYNLGSVSGKTNIGGVCGYTESGMTVNCYSLGEVGGSSNVGGVCGLNGGAIANCYFNSTKYTGEAIGNDSSGNSVNVSGKAAASFTSGEVAYLLSVGCTVGETAYDGSVWGQNIETESYPVLNGTKVYRNEVYSDCVDASVGLSYTYANAVAEAVHVDHVYEKGICQYCGNILPYAPQQDSEGVYQITNAAELYWFAGLVNGTLSDVTQNTSANAKLMNNITVNKNLLASLEYDAEDNVTNGESFTSWTPIGISNYAYNGTFNGNGKTISGLFYDNSTTNSVGLFGYIYSGKVTDVKVTDSYIRGYWYVGGVCGRNGYGEITNCGNSGKVVGTDYIGGVCGYNDSTAKDLAGCYNEGTVIGSNNYTGGVCGYNYVGMSGCYNTGSVSGSGSVGGVCGVVSGAAINCYNTGDISGSGNKIGGVCGEISSNSKITNCYNMGTVSSLSSNVGGVCGYNYSGEITDSYNTGSVNGDMTVGGVCGYISGTVKNCYSLGEVSGESGVGGVCGQTGASGILVNCYSLGGVSVSNYVGGVCGFNSGAIANCYFNSTNYTGEAIGSDFSGNSVNVSGKAAASFTNGEVAYLLSIGCTVGETVYDGSVWGQDIENDSYPVLNGTKVYCNKSYVDCVDKDNITYTYSNTEEEDIHVDHIYEDGICRYCGNIMPQAPQQDSEGVYQITNEAELYWFAGLVNGTLSGVTQDTSANAKLMNDITVNENLLASLEYDSEDNVTNGESFTSWAPIGNFYYDYNGTFNGNGKTISGLFCDNSTTDYIGLFGFIGSGKVTDVKVADSYFRGRNFVGGVCGKNKSGEITNCANSGKVVGTVNVGGVCGYIDSGAKDLTGCYNEGTVIGSGNFIGGVCGINYVGISGCYNTGSVSGDWNVGGVCGIVHGETLNCYNTGDISGSGNKIGGVCGEISSNAKITNCYNTGNVTSTVENKRFTGGVCGFNSGEMTGCYNTGKVSSLGEKVGGVCGYISGAVKNCYSLGNVSGTTYVGGVCGQTEASGILVNCYSLGGVSGDEYVGGVCGLNGGTIANCYFNSTEYTGEAVGDDSSKNTVNVSGKAASSFSNGEVAYLLSIGCTVGETAYDGSVWGQNIETETYPVLNGTKVYQNERYAGCVDAPGEVTYVYSNTEAEPSYKDHEYILGLCKYCQISVQKADGVYQITNAAELYWFAEHVNSGNTDANAKLMNNITVNSDLISSLEFDAEGDVTNGDDFTSWTPIGWYDNYTDSNYTYTGTFDGQGFTISGLYFNDPGRNQVGLFGDNCGTVKNLGVVDSYFRGHNSVGGICGTIDQGSIESCDFSGMVSGNDYVGGICGFNIRSIIVGCYNTGAVNGAGYSGGVCGLNQGRLISNCYNTGAVTATDVNSYAGGVCGINDSGIVANCYNTGAVTATDEEYYAGGVIGGNKGIVENCYFLKGSGVTAVCENQGTVGEKVLEKTTKQFNSGEVAYLLSQGCTIGEGEKAQTIEGSAWGQKLGTDGDAYPVFSEDEVYKNELYSGCIHEPGTLGYVYENVENETAYASFTEVTDDAVAPTCGATGLTEGSHCSVCGKVFVEQQTVPATGMHTYGEKVVAPTYGAEGYTLHTCSVCGDSYKDTYTAQLVLPNVTGLKMTANNANSISMSWTKVTGATGYVVYQAIDGKWQRIKVTSGNTLTVSNLKAGTNYRFTVKAYKTVSGTNYYSPSYTGVWMTTLPAKPSAKMTVNTPQAIRLEWGKVTGATGYVVYQQVNGSWVKKAVTTNNVYVATGLKSGTNYNFAVRAYRTFNGKNYYSPFATATDTIKTCTKPATVNFTLTAGAKKATVNWSKVTGATGYIVYYKTSANGSWQKLKTTTGTTYTKTGLTSGKTYYFTVKAYKTYNGKTYNASFTTKSVKVK